MDLCESASRRVGESARVGELTGRCRKVNLVSMPSTIYPCTILLRPCPSEIRGHSDMVENRYSSTEKCASWTISVSGFHSSERFVIRLQYSLSRSCGTSILFSESNAGYSFVLVGIVVTSLLMLNCQFDQTKRPRIVAAYAEYSPDTLSRLR
jgi:hypothetical protein